MQKGSGTTVKQFSNNQSTSTSHVQDNWDFYDPLNEPQHQALLPPSVKQVTPQGGIARLSGGRGQPGRPWIKWAGVLALVVLLGIIGSTSLFADGGDGGGGGGVGSTGRKSPTATTDPRPAASASPTQASTPQPSSTDSPITPTPGGTVGGQIGSLPAAWTESGRGDAEFIEAKNVAETFASHYEMLDWRSRNSFDQATFAMTQAALTQRFLQRDDRANAAFVNTFIEGQNIQTPSLKQNKTRILLATSAPSGFFVWMSVSYSLLHQQKSTPSFTDQHSLVVLLVSAPFGTSNVVGGVGWLVSDWQEGNVVFPIPQQP